MNLTLLSINFKVAPVEVREKLDVPESHLPDVLEELRARCAFQELFLLSTCNRVEFYFIARDQPVALERLKAWIAERIDNPEIDVERHVIVLTHRAATIHLLRVASSLESMVVGEPQILGQVKDAYEIAVRHRSVGPVLTGLMPRVFRAAKRVRTETHVARNAVSISYAAVELATKIFDTLEDKTVMVIGAGEMAELAMTHLLKQGIRRLLIVNRTFATAVALSEKYQGEAVAYDRLAETLPAADIVISSTGARGYIVDAEHVRRVMRGRKGRPMFFIDIAVTRDIDPAVNKIRNAYCYDIDDLNSVIDANRRERENETHKAQRIVEEEVVRFEGWFESLSAAPTIKALRQNFHVIGERELDKALQQMEHLSPRDANQVRRMVHGLLNKLLHQPSTALKQTAEQGNGKLYAEVIAQLFGLSGATGPEGMGTLPPEELDPAAEGETNVVRLPVNPKS